MPPDGIVPESRSPEGVLSDVSVVVVLHNSAEVVEACLKALPPDSEVIVVDNASRDAGLERARRTRPDLVALRSEQNLGFGPGCNLGSAVSSKPYIAFVNPDVRVEAETLPGLLAALLKRERSIVGPALVDAAGRTQRCKRAPSAWLDFCGLLPAAARWGPSGWDHRLDPDDPVHTRGGPVSSVEGSCFLVRREDLETIGGFDEDFFLYCEEESLALRTRRIGGGAVYEPRVRAVHLVGHATRHDEALAAHHFHRSRVLLYRKRDGELRGRLVGLAFLLALALELPVAALNEIFGRRRRVSRTYLRHSFSGVWAGMTARLDARISY